MKADFFDLGTGRTTIKKTSAPAKTGCAACGLHHDCSHPEFPALLKESAVVIVLEHPSNAEDAAGFPLAGESGKWLKGILKESGITATITYAVKCGGGNADSGVEHCKPRLLRELYELHPDVVIPMGTMAIRAVLSDAISGRLSGIEYKHFIGDIIPQPHYWVCPTDAPYMVFSALEKDESALLRFTQHLHAAWDQRLCPLPGETLDDLKKCVRLWERSDVEALLTRPGTYTIDYETTGIKPHRAEQQLVSMAVSDGITAGAFLVTEELKPLIKEFLQSPRFKKIAHKIDFEDMWSFFKLDAVVDAWEWDTLLCAHCLDNKKPTSLKYLVFSRFGIIYDSAVDKFLESPPEALEREGANALNRIHQAPVDELLIYNALDTLFTYRIYKQQQKELNMLPTSHRQGFRFFLEGAAALAQIQRNGMGLDAEIFKDQHTILTRRIQYYLEAVTSAPEAQRWRGKENFNPDSNQMLNKLLYEILEFPRPKKSKYGKEEAETDEAALLAIGTPFAKNIVAYRKLKKLRDTYLAQFKREEVKGRIYPFFNLHIVKTFRSSSDRPNFQNIPKRDKEAKKRIRSMIKPSPGNRLVEYDYKAVEVSISACYHQDRNMIRYIEDPKNDMHRDTAADIFMKPISEISSVERQLAKNKFVFPSFYGSTFRAISPALWEDIEKDAELKRYMASKKIKNFDAFQKHIQEVERIFWQERFPEYSAWKNKQWKLYQRRGYIDSHTGFRCYGPMVFTEVTNYQIQGSAFHCLLWTLTQVQKQLASGRCPRSHIIGQIHDALVGDIHPEEEAEFDKMMVDIGTQQIREHWPWIIVSLTLEKEAGSVDGAWTTLEKTELKI